MDTVAMLLHTTPEAVRPLLAEYGFRGSPSTPPQERATHLPEATALPPGTTHPSEYHRRFLQGRGLSPEPIFRDWGVLGTGPAGPYKLRLIIPVRFDGRVVSWDSRDITDRAPARYMACPGDQETVPRKHLLYGEDLAVGKTVIIVEGPLDAWAVGPGAVATFGTGFTSHQVKRLKRWKRRFILYDNDEAGREGAERLAAACASLPGDTYILGIPDPWKDPCDMGPKRVRGAILSHLLQHS